MSFQIQDAALEARIHKQIETLARTASKRRWRIFSKIKRNRTAG